MSEVWKRITGFDGLYEISNIGRVRSLKRKVLCKHGSFRTAPSILKVQIHLPNGYRQVVLHKYGKRYHFLVHRLVLINFINEPTKEKPQSNHKNGDKADNRLENLEWVNSSQNMRHAIDVLGRRNLPGESNPASKLKEEDVKNIRDSYCNDNLSQQNLAEKFGVTQSHISRIIRRQEWKELT